MSQVVKQASALSHDLLGVPIRCADGVPLLPALSGPWVRAEIEDDCPTAFTAVTDVAFHASTPLRGQLTGWEGLGPAAQYGERRWSSPRGLAR